MLHLHTEWKQILKKAWSLRLSLLASLFAGAEAAIPFIDPDRFGIPPGVMAAVASFVASGAALSRVIAQPKAGL